MKKIRIVHAVGIVGSVVTMNRWLINSAQLLDFIIILLIVILIHQLLPKRQSKVKAEVCFPTNANIRIT